jgi:hypothetical protein
MVMEAQETPVTEFARYVKANLQQLRENLKEAEKQNIIAAASPKVFISPVVERKMAFDYASVDEQILPLGNYVWNFMEKKHNREKLFMTFKLLFSMMVRDAKGNKPIGWLSSTAAAHKSEQRGYQTSDRAVRRNLVDLEAMGLIVKIAEHIPNRQCARYTLADHVLEVAEKDGEWIGLQYVASGGYVYWHSDGPTEESIQAQENYAAVCAEQDRKEAERMHFEKVTNDENSAQWEIEMAANPELYPQTTEIQEVESASESDREVNLKNISIPKVDFVDTLEAAKKTRKPNVPNQAEMVKAYEEMFGKQEKGFTYESIIKNFDPTLVKDPESKDHIVN